MSSSSSIIAMRNIWYGASNPVRIAAVRTMLGWGASQREIADALGISVGTIAGFINKRPEARPKGVVPGGGPRRFGIAPGRIEVRVYLKPVKVAALFDDSGAPGPEGGERNTSGESRERVPPGVAGLQPRSPTAGSKAASAVPAGTAAPLPSSAIRRQSPRSRTVEDRQKDSRGALKERALLEAAAKDVLPPAAVPAAPSAVELWDRGVTITKIATQLRRPYREIEAELRAANRLREPGIEVQKIARIA